MCIKYDFKTTRMHWGSVLDTFCSLEDGNSFSFVFHSQMSIKIHFLIELLMCFQNCLTWMFVCVQPHSVVPAFENRTWYESSGFISSAALTQHMRLIIHLSFDTFSKPPQRGFWKRVLSGFEAFSKIRSAFNMKMTPSSTKPWPGGMMYYYGA